MTCRFVDPELTPNLLNYMFMIYSLSQVELVINTVQCLSCYYTNDYKQHIQQRFMGGQREHMCYLCWLEQLRLYAIWLSYPVDFVSQDKREGRKTRGKRIVSDKFAFDRGLAQGEDLIPPGSTHVFVKRGFGVLILQHGWHGLQECKPLMLQKADLIFFFSS